jgi:hypothetical protein
MGSFKNLFLQNHWANFNQTWLTSSLERERIQVSVKEGESPCPRGDSSKRVKIQKFFKNLLQNQQAKINQTWYKLSFGEENSSLFK